MHTYRQRWADDPETWTLQKFRDFRFTNALDVVAYAELDPVLRSRNNPEVWHLDVRGSLRCGCHASSIESVRTFADDLDALLACRRTALGWPCPNRWLIVESRHPWHEAYQVDEDDASLHGSPPGARRARDHVARRDDLRPGVSLVVPTRADVGHDDLAMIRERCARRHTGRMARLVISVSDELLASVDALVAKGVFESRSNAVREALLSIVEADEATIAMIAAEPW
jgi:hypothetical protein